MQPLYHGGLPDVMLHNHGQPDGALLHCLLITASSWKRITTVSRRRCYFNLSIEPGKDCFIYSIGAQGRPDTEQGQWALLVLNLVANTREHFDIPISLQAPG